MLPLKYYNNKLDKTYDVKFLRIVNENDFKAEFTDQDTGRKNNI